MATNEEKQELVDALSGPRYYHVMINGYGGESSYSTISKEAYDFWKEVDEEHGDSELVHYVLAAEDKTVEEIREDDEFDELDPADIPREAMFLHDEDNEIGRPWFEPPNEFEHVWGVASDTARVYIEEVDGDDYSANRIADVIDGEELYELVNRIGEETDYEVEMTEVPDVTYSPARVDKGSYIFQMYSSEKGTFFEGWIETVGDFDVKKLKFHIDEAPNGEDTVFGVYYNGEEVDNTGGDTNGKGYYASVWEQEW